VPTIKSNKALLAIAGTGRFESKEGVAHSVVNRILDLVRTGMLRAGDRLPSERELIEILDISRPSLREALRALSMLGVIDSRHGGGAYVTDLEARTLLAPLDFFLSLSDTNVADTFESRRIVETEIARKAALRSTDEDLDDLRGMIAAQEAVLADPVGFRILDSRFHARLSVAAGNVILARIAYGLYNMGLDVRRRATQNPELIRQSTADHKRIVDALVARDAEGAAREMGVHLDHIEETTRSAMRANIAPISPAVVRRADRKKQAIRALRSTP
jgi:GntR family transcriptional repressor for pyruvate dehydrogenase complex